MIYSYGITLKGSQHEKEGSVCQDSHIIRKYGDSCCIAAVADGLGSEKYTDIASKIAVTESVNYCYEHININITGAEIERIIRESFNKALNAINVRSEEDNHDLDQYDTTLSLAILIQDRLYFGHSGDGGIIILDKSGKYSNITSQQRDVFGNVFPLCSGTEKWITGAVSSDVASVLLATDGIYDALFPVIIKDKEIKIHVKFVRFLMDMRSIHIDEDGELETGKRIENYISKIPESSILDDKTIVVMINGNVVTDLQPPEYYEEPDWVRLKEEYMKKIQKDLYPVQEPPQTESVKDPISPMASSETPNDNVSNEGDEVRQDPFPGSTRKGRLMERFFHHNKDNDKKK